MRLRTEFALYLLVIGLFGAVVLWADEASRAEFVLFASVVGVLLIAVVLTMRPRTVLVVGERSEEVERIGRALEEAGYETCSCAGPSNRPCPVLRGGVCPIRERPLAAVIYHPAGDEARYAPCGPALRVPSVVVEQRMDSEPMRSGMLARVGWDRDAGGIVRTMEELVAA